MAVREIGLYRYSDSNALQGAYFCLPLPLLRSALLHYPTLRLLVRAWSSGGRSQCDGNDDRPGRSFAAAPVPSWRFAHLNFDGRAGRRAINRRLAKDKRRLIVVDFENLPFKATFGIGPMRARIARCRSACFQSGLRRVRTAWRRRGPARRRQHCQAGGARLRAPRARCISSSLIGGSQDGLSSIERTLCSNLPHDIQHYRDTLSVL